MANERRDEARLADPRRPGDADRARAPGARIEVVDDAGGEGVAVLHEGDRARQRPPVASGDPRDEALARPVAAAISSATETGETSRSVTSSCAERSRRKPTSAPRPAQTAEMANTQRAPTASVNGPATTIASPSTAKFVLMMTVKTRPRTSSGAPRWTSSEL